MHSPQNSILGSPRSWYVEDSSMMNLDDELSMLSASTEVNGIMTYEKKIKNFFFDPLMYPILFCCLIAIGSTEFFLANMGSILKNLHSTQLDKNLKLFSVTSTVTRLIIMLCTDPFCTYFQVSRLTLVALSVIACAVSHIYLSSSDISTINFKLVVICNAVLNSSVFTLFPAILASIYGIEILGTTWGLFSSASIVGNMLLNLTYSFDFTKNCVSTVDDTLVICSTMTFFISGLVILCFGSLVLLLKGKYLKRAKDFF
ncbi:unnamed protein product [Ambrosiozyma monospora]|uniref:Unnamed protein product n=1 Tax=Ambrosiozyma monospora TaxID=43982 RepID=A0A9W6W819_AMBMO|nr:unnamed protein product [Ambrosiozyma monospora]